MRQALFNYLKCLVIPFLMGGSVACETKSVESIIGRGKFVHSVAELQKAKTCEVYRVDDSYPEEIGLSKVMRFKVLPFYQKLSQ